MAEGNNSLLHFEDTVLDVNENMPNSERCPFSNSESSIEHISNLCVSNITCSQEPSIFCETTAAESPIGCTEVSENSFEISSNKLDAILKNVDISNHKDNLDKHDSENNVIEPAKLIDFQDIDQNFCESNNMFSDFIHQENGIELKDEEFHDAVQFFKDPSSLVFLENAGSSGVPLESSMARSSLYQKFDPLHAKFFSQASIKSNELHEIAEHEIEPGQDNHGIELIPNDIRIEVDHDLQNATASFPETTSDEIKNDVPDDTASSDAIPGIQNKHLSNVSPRQSIGNILISFDSPVIPKDENIQKTVDENLQKMYSEEEFQQALKNQELAMQETFLKKQHELELKFSEAMDKVEQQKHLSNSFHVLLKEVMDIIYIFSDNEKELKQKLEAAEKENNKLKEDLKTSEEDLQSIETTFSDFHKRYEQSKNMIKVYVQNESSLKQQLENKTVQLHEKEEMYKALQSRTQEMLDKANAEVANAKKAGEAQVAVLNAQLKKAELKISSLERDVKQVKIENEKLNSICEELMAKVSGT